MDIALSSDLDSGLYFATGSDLDADTAVVSGLDADTAVDSNLDAATAIESDFGRHRPRLVLRCSHRLRCVLG